MRVITVRVDACGTGIFHQTVIFVASTSGYTGCMVDLPEHRANPELAETFQPQGFFASPFRIKNNWDVVSVGSFVAATAFGVVGVCNRIRERFFHAFVLGHGETRTPFSDINQKYNGKLGVLPTSDSRISGLFDAISVKSLRKTITPEAYSEQRKALVTEYRNAIAERLEKNFNIPTHGWRGMTIGNWKRWEQLGVGAKRETALVFAGISTVALGALAIMRNSKNTLERVEEKLDERSGAGR